MDEAGISAAKSQKIIGHKTQSMRQRYRIVPTKDIVAAGEQLDRYLESQMGDSEGEIVH